MLSCYLLADIKILVSDQKYYQEKRLTLIANVSRAELTWNNEN